MMTAYPNSIRTTSVYIGYFLLKEILRQGKGEISFLDASETLQKHGLEHSRQLTIGLSFLYSLGIVEFSDGMIRAKIEENL